MELFASQPGRYKGGPRGPMFPEASQPGRHGGFTGHVAYRAFDAWMPLPRRKPCSYGGFLEWGCRQMDSFYKGKSHENG